jgi:hypothetical protein
MKNLGRIVFLIIVSALSLSASVTAKVTPEILYSGDEATYSLSVVGEKVTKPILKSICGSDVLATSSQTNITMVDFETKKSYIFSYKFAPQKSCTIEPVSVEVDGKHELSNSVTLTIKPATQNKNEDFLLQLKSAKKELFVGEPFDLTLILKQKKSAEVLDSKFIAPDFQGFWIKSESLPQREESTEYIITTMHYTLAAQRVGKLTIKPAKLRIAKRVNTPDMWGSFMPQIKWKSYFSNSVDIIAKPLPGGLKLVGNFTISAKADKDTIGKNEAVNVTVEVVGDGNLEDIESFKPEVDGVNVFAQKIKIEGNKLIQKLAFVADDDFTIPSFSLKFYNQKARKIETIKTKPIPIHVRGGAKKVESLTIKRDQGTSVVNNENIKRRSLPSFLWLVIVFVLGVAIGVFLTLFMRSFAFIKPKNLFEPRDQKVLLMKLMPYRDEDSDVAALIDTLESNIYRGQKREIDKKLLKEIISRHNIS